MNVPGGKYQSDATAATIIAFSAQDHRRRYAATTTSHAEPYATKIDFISVDDASMPTSPTT